MIHAAVMNKRILVHTSYVEYVRLTLTLICWLIPTDDLRTHDRGDVSKRDSEYHNPDHTFFFFKSPTMEDYLVPLATVCTVNVDMQTLAFNESFF